MRRIHLLVCSLSVGLSLLTSRAFGDAFTYTAQTRSAFAAQEGQYSSSQMKTAPNFGLFDATARADELSFGFGEPTGAFAQQTQKSELLPDKISASGGWSGLRPAFVGQGAAKGLTITDITFTVASLTEVELSAVIGLYDPDQFFYGGRTVSLTGPGTNISWSIYNFLGPLDPWTGSRSTTAMLAPGSYRFYVELGSFQGGFQPIVTAVGSYNVQLTAIPEPASLAGALLVAASLILYRRKPS